MSQLTIRKRRAWFWYRILICIVVSATIQLVAPWWSLIPVAMLIGFATAPMNKSPFLAGFLALFLLWAGWAFWIDLENNSILSERVIRLFPLPHNSLSLILLTGFFGGLINGMAMLTGDIFRRFFLPEEEKYYR
jgi:hypothetical protein